MRPGRLWGVVAHRHILLLLLLLCKGLHVWRAGGSRYYPGRTGGVGRPDRVRARPRTSPRARGCCSLLTEHVHFFVTAFWSAGPSCWSRQSLVSPLTPGVDCTSWYRLRFNLAYLTLSFDGRLLLPAHLGSRSVTARDVKTSKASSLTGQDVYDAIWQHNTVMMSTRG